MRIARYHRVSTEEQKLERQSRATDEYIDANFSDADVSTFTDASTGTNTAREEYIEMMDAIEDGEFDVVVIKSISRISRSIRDLSKTVDRIGESGASLHIIDENLRIDPDSDDPMQKAMWQFLGVFAEFEAEMTRKRIKEGIAAKQATEDYHHGPAPLGFRKEEGSLIQEPNFDTVVSVLEMVAKDQLSKRQAAKELECGRKTIRRAINDRPELYGIEGVEPEDPEDEIKDLHRRLRELEKKHGDR